MISEPIPNRPRTRAKTRYDWAREAVVLTQRLSSSVIGRQQSTVLDSVGDLLMYQMVIGSHP